MSEDKEDNTERTAGGMSAKEAVDAIEKAGGRHKGYRRLHARGGVYEGSFRASGAVRDLTTAQYLHDAETPLLVRFSNGYPDPEALDTQPGVRGMAVRFMVDRVAATDLVAANFRVFPSHNPEGFIELVELQAESAGDHADPATARAKLGAFMQRYPESAAALQGLNAQGVPGSAATTRYDGLHAYFMVDGSGVRHAFRYRLVPDAGEVEITPEEATKRDPHFWLPELDERLAHGPVGFALVFQLAAEGDVTNNPSVVWGEDRQLVTVGHIEVSRKATNAPELEREVFDPTRVPEGIALSDDPVLRFRAPAYAVSAERRLKGE